ncbi:MAG: hypothetical protein LBT47_09690 [Deltaproteobacteria bacterium]|jgi:hypothetical protein|nr:hypothetical protein [Deltaproteobacteria bacterium]
MLGALYLSLNPANGWMSAAPESGPAPQLPSGNRCGHDHRNPQLSPPSPIKKGLGGLPRILSLAAERAKDWFHCPDKCPPLGSNSHRRTRSERREACQIVLEVLLSRLDLASLCVGSPAPASGFIDLDMKTIVRESGLGKRRCERAIGQFKEAGFIKVEQPRRRNEEGKYFGLQAIRIFTQKFFDWLGLGSMLKKERNRASASLKRKTQAAGKSLGDLMKRLAGKVRLIKDAGRRAPMDQETVRAWNRALSDFLKNGLEIEEAQRLTNLKFGFLGSWSPGQGRLEGM